MDEDKQVENETLEEKEEAVETPAIDVAGEDAAPTVTDEGNFWDSFEDASLKENGSVRKFKSVEALAKSYVGLQRKLGERPVATKPPENATPEQLAAWRSLKRGGIENEVDYGFKPEVELENFDAKNIGKALFESGADRDLYNNVMKEVFKAEENRRMLERRSREDGEAELRDEWHEDYEVNMRAAKMFVKNRFPEVFKGLEMTDAFRIPSVARMFKQLNELTADGEIRIQKAAAESYEERLRSIETSDAFKNEWHPGHRDAHKAWRELMVERTTNRK